MQQHWLNGNASLNQPNRVDCGGARLSGNRIFLMTTGFSMQEMTLADPPQMRHVSTSTLKTRLSRCAQIMAA